MRKLCHLCGLLLAGCSSTAFGQFYGWNPWAYGPWGPSYHHASTVQEGVQRGFADIVRSTGVYNLMTSEAMKRMEDARRKYIDNRVYSTEKYFEMQRINREARAAKRRPRVTMEQAIRLAAAHKPDRLSPSELDPLSGKISWPMLLRDEVYRDDRAKLERIYAERAVVGFLTEQQFMEVAAVTEKMKAELKSRINAYPPQAYIQAKRFLESLAYESNFRPG